MARIRRKISYSDTRAELAEAKDVRRGASEDEFWDEDELVDYRPSSKYKKKSKRKGCPENDGKAHVYIWVDRVVEYNWFREDGSRIAFRYRDQICCGCEHKKDSKFMGRL